MEILPSFEAIQLIIKKLQKKANPDWGWPFSFLGRKNRKSIWLKKGIFPLHGKNFPLTFSPTKAQQGSLKTAFYGPFHAAGGSVARVLAWLQPVRIPLGMT